MKKKLLALLVIGSAVVASSCNKIKEATNQNITLTGAEVTLVVSPKDISTGSVELQSATATSDIDALIKEKASGFGLKNVKSLKVKTLTAEITEGFSATSNFSSFKDLSATLEAPGKTPFIASYTGTPSASSTSISFTVSNAVDLKDLVSAGTVKYTLKGTVLSKPTTTLTLKVKTTYDVVVGL
ncbi:hypothetical protein [Pedobacter ureilyticus]|mgnify:CR=1 FL=1|uniref:DUF1735 domain-containing protein n=1 Tax=Pedobacter ureilyticus TaxID=1393051 RepID=A0ABW9J1D4_9SPHI|nr:hypothetical protein [Pedobacter helvus]